MIICQLQAAQKYCTQFTRTVKKMIQQDSEVMEAKWNGSQELADKRTDWLTNQPTKQHTNHRGSQLKR
jgi:hypothetical protein